MKATNYILFAAAAIALAACSNDGLPGDDPNAPVEIRLTGGLEVQTRTSHNLDTQLKNGEQVHVWVDDAGNVADKELYKDRELTAGESGALTGETMYFPQTDNAVDIYAIHGNFDAYEDWSSGGFWGEVILHWIEQDQKSTTDGYAKSDLVYAKSPNVTRTKSAVNLQFSHLLSKIEVVLVQGAGSPEIAKMEILNTKIVAKFTPDKANGFSVKAEDNVGEIGNPIEIDTHQTDAKTAANTDSDEGKELNEAVIVPQLLTKDTPFIRITTTAGGELVYKLPEDKTFDPAKKYRFTVTANLTELKVVSAKITDWAKETGDDNGTAEMEE
ncbi:fimbrillin family protein [Phocaeicola dorei]|mgnify:CR=1 FL=1|uniref:fimbrillin family protein n=1 Tax=Phocaeicola dorei TaxID=357276 RepID=UPI00187367F4|nr:fimbrillin family protein [Phocaeicola dorei]MBE5080255.1 fimbrillin family protein [Phocaeicola dorei]